MSAPADLSGGPARPGLPLAETIDLFGEAAAFFDDGGELTAANEAFRQIYAAISEFLREGTGWTIFLMEAEHHGLLPKAACDRLRLIEDQLLDGPAPPPPVEARGPQGGAWLIRLAATSDGGFALIQSRTVDREARADSDRQAEVLMSKVLEACPANLTMARVGDGQILYRTPAATELLGTGRNSRDHFAFRDERADFVTALLPDARVDDMRVTGRRKDGARFPASVSARLIEYRGEEVVVSNMIDLSDELAMQDELARQKDLNFQSEKMSALGELLAGVAHELNNPLSVVVGNAMMLKEEPLDASVLRRIDKLADAAERCVKIVRTFLSMVREQPLELSRASVADLVDTALDAYRSGAEPGGVTISYDIPETLPDLAVDDVQIVQVLMNLLINADQAIRESGTGDRIRISARQNPRLGTIEIRVCDNGPGVPAELRNRIFDPLFTTKAPGKGTGVGLAFCHRVVAAHGGSITLDRHFAGGAGFVLSLKPAP